MSLLLYYFISFRQHYTDHIDVKNGYEIHHILVFFSVCSCVTISFTSSVESKNACLLTGMDSFRFYGVRRALERVLHAQKENDDSDFDDNTEECPDYGKYIFCVVMI